MGIEKGQMGGGGEGETLRGGEPVKKKGCQDQYDLVENSGSGFGEIDLRIMRVTDKILRAIGRLERRGKATCYTEVFCKRNGTMEKKKEDGGHGHRRRGSWKKWRSAHEKIPKQACRQSLIFDINGG